MKPCSKCGLVKPLSDYYKCSRLKSGYHAACKKCMDDMNRASRKKNPELYKQINKDQQDYNLAVFTAWKSKQKCLCCPEDRYQCLDLHHLDPNEKEGHIAELVRGWTWKRLEKELEKCVVVCRNCHAFIHAGLLSINCGFPQGTVVS